MSAYPVNAAPTHATMAMKSAPAWKGIAFFISFSTPDGEVNGVEPVKFIARNELIAETLNSSAKASSPPTC